MKAICAGNASRFVNTRRKRRPGLYRRSNQPLAAIFGIFAINRDRRLVNPFVLGIRADTFTPMVVVAIPVRVMLVSFAAGNSQQSTCRDSE